MTDPKYGSDSSGYDAEAAWQKVYGDNIFSEYIRRLEHLIVNLDMVAIEKLFKEWGMFFSESARPLEEKLEMLSACYPLFSRFKEEIHSTLGSHLTNRVMAQAEKEGHPKTGHIGLVLTYLDPGALEGYLPMKTYNAGEVPSSSANGSITIEEAEWTRFFQKPEE
ncbi:MAG: hypothetical protein KJ709_09140 [Nanoarchaeota archaeon]|nr:hypothetical protein [Nanoarchaeota archaeon]